MAFYNHKKVEKKWQKEWARSSIYKTNNSTKNPKCYVLDMFPYPSGEGLHVGHPKGYIATDIYSRFKKMNGFNILHPMGWDAFGLPAENFAIKNKIHPQISVEKNIKRFKEQLSILGFNYDWSREINTTDPAYYKWTQWIFLQFFKKGLAYESYEPINWCPSCQTGLANEDVEDGLCERCGTVVEKKPMRQWVLRITKYADRLLQDLEKLNWPESIKESQRNWIGRSEGAEIEFQIKGISTDKIIFASNNQGKLRRMQMLFKAAGISIKLLLPKEIGVEDFDVVEDGRTLAENAEKKARTVAEKTKLPVLADDSGFFIDNVEIDPITVKRNALKGKDEKSMSVEEVGCLMLEYYRKIASKRGGLVDAEWRNALCVVTPEKSAIHIETIRPVTLTDKPRGTMDPHLPLRPLYISKATGKYVLEQTENEEMKELEPITEGIKKLFAPSVKIFTTRPDTLFGATYMVLAPEHELLQTLKSQIQNWKEVESYIKKTKEKTEIERTTEGKEKTGVELKGIKAINPATKKEIPVFIADYVLAHYGTGAIMAVPAHDERDFAFAKKFNLPMVKVIQPILQKIVRNVEDVAMGVKSSIVIEAECWEGDGELSNSGKFDGMSSEGSKRAITEFVGGKMTVQYKLRDWVFSRQRYWGEPIPLVHCAKCGVVPVPEKDLPLKLPKVISYAPTGTGESPLADIAKWVNTKCPKCVGPAKRETNTMPQWAGSSWYYLRYVDPKNKKTLVDKKKEKYWSPVDLYMGGAEHATRHLIYARFWHKFLYDIGIVNYKEPFQRLQHVGLIMAEDGRKMSKRFGNVINPDDIVDKVGADALRMYEMFMGPFDQAAAWSTAGIMGPRRFLDRVWVFGTKFSIFSRLSPSRVRVGSNADSASKRPAIEQLLNKTIKKVTEDIETFRFNTAISQLMILLNEFEKSGATNDQFKIFLRLLAPFAPHITEELWNKPGNKKSIHIETWPKFDPKLLIAETFDLVVQVNGKYRDKINVPIDISQKEAEALIFAREKVKTILGDKSPRKVIFVPRRLINIVV